MFRKKHTPQYFSAFKTWQIDKHKEKTVRLFKCIEFKLKTNN